MSERNVTEGESFYIPGVQDHANDVTITIAPKCDADEGRWRCMTHNEIFANNFQRDGHTEGRGHHEMAWHCFHHGPEVP